MSTITSYSFNVQHLNLSKNGNSILPKAKVAAIAICAFTLSSANIAINQGSNNLNFSTKSKREIFEISNGDKIIANLLTFDNKKGDEEMSELKLNEVQKYFDEKISEVKDSVHNVDNRLSVIENELGHIKKEIETIPNVIESTIQLTLNKIEKEKKGKWWDRYGAPTITGVVVAVITVGGPYLLKLLHIIK